MMKSLMILFLSLIVFVGCSHSPDYFERPYDERYQVAMDQKPIEIPDESEPGEVWDRIYNKLFRKFYDFIDIPSWGRSIGETLSLRNPKESENVNAWDEAPDSSWFTNRIGRRNTYKKWTSEMSAKGPRTAKSKPDLSQPLIVVGGKSNGVSAGFTVKDSRGELYFIKFDPSGNQELGSGAEVISSLLLHAAGYNVPAYYALEVEPKKFKLSPKAKTPGKYGVKRPMTEKDLKDILNLVPLNRKGKLRMSVSHALEGKPIGPFMYEGTRCDDSNDKIRHEHRRELRGYHVFSAWINNTDVRFQNTLDMYVGKSPDGYVRHNMLDFGTTLGGAGHRVKSIRNGYEEFLDYSEMGKNIVAFGTREPYWKDVKETPWPSIGVFESKVFDPLRWRTQYNNRASELITNRDAFWAAKIIMKFSDKDIAAIVNEAHYSNEKASEYMVKTLIERRDKIGKVFYSRITPVDEFELTSKNEFLFEDLALKAGFSKFSNKRYRLHLENSKVEKDIPVVQVGGKLQALLGSQLKDENTLSIHVFNESGKEIAKGAEIAVACPEKNQKRCLITGVKRNY